MLHVVSMCHVYMHTLLVLTLLCVHRITGTLPRVIGLLGNLQTLDLSSNEITGFLPTTWGLLSNLTTL